MTKYSRLLVALFILPSILFVQCKNPNTTEAQEETQIDASISEIDTEAIDSTEGAVIDDSQTTVTTTDNNEPPVIEKTKTITDKTEPPVIEKTKKTTVDNTKPVVIEETKTITVDNTEPTVIEKTKTITVEKPAAPEYADFYMKSVKATIEGTSTLHGWESNVTIIEGKGSFQLKDNMLASIKNAEVKIAVKGIKSEEGKKMDNKTYETFKSDDYPYIVYTFSNAEVKIKESSAVSMETTGKLSMAGVSKSVPIAAHGKVLPNGDLQLTVSKKLKMTDFNMEPPVMFLGTIKVGDEITVNFDFVLSKNK